MNKDTRRNLQVSTGVIGFVTMLLMAVWSGQASAADVGKRMIDDVWHITYDGRVLEGDAAKLKAIFEANPDIEWVSFNSPGGDGYEGTEISRVMDEYIMSARVRDGNSCMSACATGFIGAHAYSVEGTLGFHSFRYAKYDGEGRTRIEKKDIRSSIYYAQATGSLDIYNIMLNGFSWDLYFDYTGEFGEFIEFNSNEELKEYYIGPMEFSKSYKNSRGDKEFVDFQVKDTDSTFIKYGTRIGFKKVGTYTFFKNSPPNGDEYYHYVLPSSFWVTGGQQNGYTYIHSGRSASGMKLVSGWVKTELLQKLGN